MLDIITNPDFWLLVGLYWVFSAFVGALPPIDDPRVHGSLKYEIAYKVLHALAGNLKNAFASKIPGEHPPA